MISEEKKRLDKTFEGKIHPWKKWGPYVSERAWATVREDYSENGDAWRYFSHDAARSRTYRWGEDGIAGICDMYQTLAFSLAFWNGKDPILKERLFGLTPFEGNHGEDVKEYYFYLDSTPTHSYMKYLYKYPHAAYPYDQLVQENQRRNTYDREFELIDTGVFNENRYFDIVIEYAKAGPEDICIRIEAFNRGPEAATLHVLPQIVFRNRWSWNPEHTIIPIIKQGPSSEGAVSLFADPNNLPAVGGIPFDYIFEPIYLYAEASAQVLFTNNESNNERLYQVSNRTPYVKDAFHRHIIEKEACVNPEKEGSKAAFHFNVEIPAGGSHAFHLRLSPEELKNPLQNVKETMALRLKEADEFYDEIQPKHLSAEDKKIQRQAFAGMLWSKQFYHYHVEKWFEGDDPAAPPPKSREKIRNFHWKHIYANAVISMPDKWEYPWFAAWDLAFHTVALAHVDIDFAKQQLQLLLTYRYQHPNGQVPAYEWGFSDLNPPVQAWALWRLYRLDGSKDTKFLELAFLALTRNFGWWVNIVDKQGNNFFEGGFLGLDNISVIDRSRPLPGGGFFEESDGTGWMGFFSLTMMKIALELSKNNFHFQELATVFFEHFVNISKAMQGTKKRPTDMWNEEDGFFYDVISYPDGAHQALKIRSFVGIIPFFSLDFLEEEEISQFSKFYGNFHLFLKECPDLCHRCITPIEKNGKKGYLLSLMNFDQMKKVLQKIWDHDEFLSPYGLRSISKVHEKHPYVFDGSSVGYEPGESLERIKGGNSNWRGPIWFPTNFLVIDSLVNLYKGVGESFTIKTKQQDLPLEKAAQRLRNHLIDLFRENKDKRRPVHGDYEIFQTDPYWKDLLLFYEHYHADTGRGLGASHQTGWSGLVAALIAEL